MMVTKKLSTLQQQILHYLAVHEGELVKQEDVAQVVGSVQPAVNRSMKQLLRYGVLMKKGTHYYVTKKGQSVLEEWEMTPLQLAVRRLQEVESVLPMWLVDAPMVCEVAALELLPAYQQVHRMLQRVGARIMLIDGQARVQMFDGEIPIAVVEDGGMPRILHQEEMLVGVDEAQNVYIKVRG